MKLTDFPSEIERPSLPVTPAPVRRPSFWGAERDAAGDLPPAEGVPEQSDWDPSARLAELQRQQSEVLEKGPTGLRGRTIPERKMPESSSKTATGIAEEAEEATTPRPPQIATSPTPDVGPTPAIAPAPAFGTLNFAGGGQTMAAAPGREEVGPTES